MPASVRQQFFLRHALLRLTHLSADGRQPVYLTSLALLCVGSLGASMSVNVPQLVIGRTIQAFGASSVISVGAATISDIYRLEERGSAMGILFGVCLLHASSMHH